MATKLSPADLDLLGRARELAAANGIDDLRKIRAVDSGDAAMATAQALGAAQYLLDRLATLVESLAGEP